MKKIEITIDRVMFEKKASGVDLAEKIGLTPVMLSRIKTGNIKALRLTTLAAICTVLDCEPGDILVLKDDEDDSG